MDRATKTIHIDPGSETSLILKEADESPVEIDVNGSRYLLARIHDAVEPEAGPEQGDSLLNIIGIGASEEPTNIAQHERAYLADAIAPEPHS
jgi:hypothetical protein